MKSNSSKIVGALALAGAVVGLSAVVGACSGETKVTCGTGSTDCSGTCTVLGRDPENCGTCGTKCGAGQVCSMGSCSSSCSGGSTKCGDLCVDVKSDPENCGGCGTKCGASEVCSAGKCSSNGCGMSLTQCGMACVNTQVDPTNCGACGTTCTQGLACTAGKCALSCQPGFTVCNTSASPVVDAGVSDAAVDAAADSGPQLDAGPGKDICVDLINDDRNCGACGNKCTGNTRCSAGKCSYCTFCGGSCMDLRNDDNNCKACGNKCSADGGASSCKNNACCQQKIGTVYLQDDFSDTSSNWTLDAPWQIGPAKASVGCSNTPGQDPANDHTGGLDNGLAGVNIGGCTGTALTTFKYATSKVFNTANANKVVLSYWRHLHSDYTPYMLNRVEVYDGTTWQVAFATADTGTDDQSWTRQSFDLTQYKNATMQVRFGYNIGAADAYNAAGWSLDDVLVADEDCSP